MFRFVRDVDAPMPFRETHSARANTWRIVIATSGFFALVLIVVIAFRASRGEAAVDAAKVPPRLGDR